MKYSLFCLLLLHAPIFGMHESAAQPHEFTRDDEIIAFNEAHLESHLLALEACNKLCDINGNLENRTLQRVILMALMKNFVSQLNIANPEE